MAKHLIFFSGGVESTALMAFANYCDIVLTVDIYLGNNLSHSINKTNCKKIANSYGLDVLHTQIVIPQTNIDTNFVHQLEVFNGIAHNMCCADPSITHVWHGLNMLEPKPHAIDVYNRTIKSWKILQPTVLLEFPLSKFSKQQQWDSIPWDIKPYVNSCITYNNCGICSKCLEVKKYIK